MHPHVVDPQLCALPHGGICRLGFGPNHYGCDTAGDRLQVGIGAIPFDGLGIRVDGEDFIASVPQTFVHDVAAVSLWVPGNPCHRNPFVGEEVGGGLLDGFHEDHHTDCATITEMRQREWQCSGMAGRCTGGCPKRSVRPEWAWEVPIPRWWLRRTLLPCLRRFS